MIFVIIATAWHRNHFLKNRSLVSVYQQKNIAPTLVKIIIVDDNDRMNQEYSPAYFSIKQIVSQLRKMLNLAETAFQTYVIKNTRTQHHSGTGAWNSGLHFMMSFPNWESSYVAILDDDDEYLPDYLSTCYQQRTEKNIYAAIFCRLIWKTGDTEVVHELTSDLLTPRNFFIGNPGVQGSNLFIKATILLDIGGFDETFPSATDRELMIRLLDEIERHNQVSNQKYLLKVVEKPLVIHHNHGGKRVNSNIFLKKAGLDLFYQKYCTRFSKQDFLSSLERAKRLFQYEYQPRK
jgi:glycosyltransferase involved in cell wall biosynthesis